MSDLVWTSMGAPIGLEDAGDRQGEQLDAEALGQAAGVAPHAGRRVGLDGLRTSDAFSRIKVGHELRPAVDALAVGT